MTYIKKDCILFNKKIFIKFVNKKFYIRNSYKIFI